MSCKIIPIGTSKGIRIPKYLLEKYGFSDKVCLIDTDNGLLITPFKEPRAGWKDAFEKAMAKIDTFETFVMLRVALISNELTYTK